MLNWIQSRKLSGTLNKAMTLATNQIQRTSSPGPKKTSISNGNNSISCDDEKHQLIGFAEIPSV